MSRLAMSVKTRKYNLLELLLRRCSRRRNNGWRSCYSLQFLETQRSGCLLSQREFKDAM